MKKLITLALLFSLAACAHAQRTQLPVPLVPTIRYGQIALGPDNLMRIVWSGDFPLVAMSTDYAPNGDYAYGAVRVDTYDSNGKLLTRGANYGPWAGWGISPPIAVGPNNDTHLGWIDDAWDWFVQWNMSPSNTLANNQWFPINNGGYKRNPVLGMAVDWGDNVWLDYLEIFSESPSGAFTNVNNVWWMPAQNFAEYTVKGGTARVTGYAMGWYGNYSAMDIPWDPRGPSAEPSSIIADSGNVDTSWYTSIGAQIYFGPWADFDEHPNFLTTTPDGRFQEWWLGRPNGRNNQLIVDFNPDGSVYSMVWIMLPTNWAYVSVAGCQFGGDGNLRCLAYNAVTQQWATNIINPNAVSFTQLKVFSNSSF